MWVSRGPQSAPETSLCPCGPRPHGALQRPGGWGERWSQSPSCVQDWILAVLGERARQSPRSPSPRWVHSPPPRSRAGPAPPPASPSVPQVPQGGPSPSHFCPTRSNVAKVNIFYQELNYRTVDETPVYSVSRPGAEASRGQPRARHAGAPPRHGPARRGRACSLSAAVHRCRSCFRPWAASGACGSAPPCSRSWSCWSCCWTPQPSPCCWAAAGFAGLGSPSQGRE